MFYKDLFFAIHWLPVVVVSLASLAITYGWSRIPAIRGFRPDPAPGDVSGSARFTLVFALVTLLLQLLAFANLSLVISEQGWIQGVLTGFVISIVWVLPALVTANRNGTRSLWILLRDSGLYVVLYSTGGLVLGVW